MSAYSDWKVGAITDEKYKYYSQLEARRDEYVYEREHEEREDEREEYD